MNIAQADCQNYWLRIIHMDKLRLQPASIGFCNMLDISFVGKTTFADTIPYSPFDESLLYNFSNSLITVSRSFSNVEH
jgi:hypothetical protein